MALFNIDMFKIQSFKVFIFIFLFQYFKFILFLK